MVVVLLDIDGTLLDAGGAGRAALVAAMRQELGPDIPEAKVEIAGRTDRGILADLLMAYELPVDEENFSRLLQMYLDHLPAELERATGCVLPGVLELLAALSSMEDTHLGLLTGNVAVAAQAKLEHHQIHTPFAFGGFGDDHADRADVAAAAIADAERHLGRDVPPEQVVVIGDTRNDIRCARAVGAAAIAVETGFASPEELRDEGADLQLENFVDAEPVLAFIRSRNR
jgi:phosphoglycolate phosphatase